MKLFFVFIQCLCISVKPVYPQKIDNISLHLSLALSPLFYPIPLCRPLLSFALRRGGFSS